MESLKLKKELLSGLKLSKVKNNLFFYFLITPFGGGKNPSFILKMIDRAMKDES